MNFEELMKQQNNQNNEKQTAEYFLVIGANLQDEEGNKMFVSLPQPLGLDTMKKSEIKGVGDFQERLCYGNDLLENLLNFAKTHLEPGEDLETQELTVRIKRRQTSQEVKHQKMNFNFTVAN